MPKGFFRTEKIKNGVAMLRGEVTGVHRHSIYKYIGQIKNRHRERVTYSHVFLVLYYVLFSKLLALHLVLDGGESETKQNH